MTLASLASAYTNITGIGCDFMNIPIGVFNARVASEVASPWQVLGSDVPLTQLEPGPTDAWVVNEVQLGVASQLNAFEDLTSLLTVDKSIAWNQLPHSARSTAVVYGGRVLAMPVFVDPFMLYYR